MMSHLSFSLTKDQPQDSRLNVGIDMGKNKWVSDTLDTLTGKHSRRTFSGDRYLLDACEYVSDLLSTGRHVEVIYEAGRNGFTPARLFERLGAGVTVIPVNKLEVLKSGKTAKSDRLDARSMSERNTEAPGFPSVWIPSVDQECQRRLLNEEQRILKDIKRNNNRMLGIFERWAVPSQKGHRSAEQWRALLQHWKEVDLVAESLPEVELACLENLIDELALLQQHLQRWQQRMAALLDRQREEAAKQNRHHIIDVLLQYKGIGEVIARALVWHVGDFERFPNAKKFASYLGLTPVPWESGTMHRNQGISKAGNPRLRSLLIELAWLWHRHQSDSPLIKKWAERLSCRGRSRKTAIVAVARQLAVALFGLIRHGRQIEGAVKNKQLAALASTPASPLA